MKVTVINPPFLKLLRQLGPAGIISSLSQEVFADIKVCKRSLSSQKVVIYGTVQACEEGGDVVC